MNENLFKNRAAAYISPGVFAGCPLDANGIPELSAFNFSTLKKDGTIVNFGKRRTGKSVMTRHQCSMLQDVFPRGIVISVTEELNGWYREFIPERFIHNEMNDKLIHDLLEFQKEVIKDPDYAEMKAEDEDFSRVFIIFDDVISDENQIRYSKPLQKIFIAGRHFDCLSIFNTQYPKAIPPSMRDNVDYFFLFKSMSGPTKEFLWKLAGDTLPKNLFYALWDKYSQDHNVLVFDNTDSQEEALHKKFFYAKADINLPPFRMGDDAFWEEEQGDEIAQGFKDNFSQA